MELDWFDHAVDFKPRDPVAKFTDANGDERIIHRPKGRRLSVFNGGNTPVLRMNRAAAILIGRRIRDRRIQLGMSQTKLCLAAGLKNMNPKQYISSLERASRKEGMRFGTLFAMAHAMSCQPADLMPTVAEVIALAGITREQVETLTAG